MIRNNGLGYASPINFSEKNYFHVTFDRFCKKINASDHVTYRLLFLLFFSTKMYCKSYTSKLFLQK